MLALCAIGLLGWNRKARRRMQEQLAEARRQIELMEGLEKNPGWVFLKELGEAQVGPRKNKVLLEPCNPEKQAEQEYVKGEIQGIEMMLRFPKLLTENAKAVVKMAREGGLDKEE